MTNNPVQYHEGDFPPKRIEWERLIPLIGPASAALARYDGTLTAVPNAALLLSPLMTQEAVLSSRIEGTQATMGEVLEFEAGVGPKIGAPDRTADIQEVLNYRKAMRRAVELLDELPLCQRLIKETHKVLMQGVRGQNKSPGEYRKIQNWIGPPGTPIERAHYIPVSAEKLPAAMSQWERFIHDQTKDKLVQLALLHAEFEAVHPFLDGNGRLGRMFIPLFLYHEKLIQSPMFYISAYFEARREEYYERLRQISRGNDWTGWCSFFLNAMTAQAQENHQKATAILKLYESVRDRIIDLTHSQFAIKALDFLFVRPIFQTSAFVHEADIPVHTAKKMIKKLHDSGMFKVLRQAKGRESAVMAFRDLLNIAEGHEAF
jgi:Fic family protein